MINLEMAKDTAIRMAIRGVIGLWLTAVFVCPASADSPPPAPPAQLQALSNQIAGLQAQRQAKQTELNKANADILQLQGLLLAAKSPQAFKDPALRAWLLSQGLDPDLAGFSGGLPLDKMLNKEIQAQQQKQDAITQQISDLDKQINDLQATLQDLQNPSQIQKALDDEKAHKASLNNQQATGDDAGQLGWDKTNTDARIKELNDRLNAIGKLESDFQQLGPGGTSGASSGQGGSQGSYSSSPQTTGTTSSMVPGQIPWGYQPPESSVRIDHNQLQQSLGGSDKNKSGSGSGMGSCPG